MLVVVEMGGGEPRIFDSSVIGMRNVMIMYIY